MPFFTIFECVNRKVVDRKTTSFFFVIIALLLPAVLGVSCANRESYLDVPKDLPKGYEDKYYTKVVVYYPVDQAIVKEEYEVPKTDNLLKAAIDQVLNGKPDNSNIIKIGPSNVKVLDAKISGRTAIVNFDKHILDFKASAESQRVVLASLVYTATQFDKVKELKILVEGKVRGEIDGRRIENLWGDVTLKEQPWKADGK